MKFWFILPLFLLFGCGFIPPPLSILHTGLDALLWETTGKTSSEHGLSKLTGKECKFLRVLNNNKICMNEEEFLDMFIEMNCEVYVFDKHSNPSCLGDKD